ncbi:hypothetical protein RND81_14G210200 [Saponaria officinalis]|uniref:Phytocyanin domain-containing protein n=1 Tax=Saponaria officinalis TaxID=3572 RepID=A0AAW1GTG7_SAPOF
MTYYFDASNCLKIIVICICALGMSMVDSKIINVGDDRWDDSTNYVSWAQNYIFSVGDVLEFSYSPGTHNVYEVTKETFRSCDTSSGVIAKYETGDDHILLKEAKPYWFICTIDDHCRVGMKLAINVTGAAMPSNPPSIQPKISGSSTPRKHVTFVAAAFLSILLIFS